MSVCLPVYFKLKILVTTEPFGFYSSGSCGGFKLFSWGGGTPPTPQKMKISPPPKKIVFKQLLQNKWQYQKYLFLKLPLGAKPPEAKGEAASEI